MSFCGLLSPKASHHALPASFRWAAELGLLLLLLYQSVISILSPSPPLTLCHSPSFASPQPWQKLSRTEAFLWQIWCNLPSGAEHPLSISNVLTCGRARRRDAWQLLNHSILLGGNALLSLQEAHFESIWHMLLSKQSKNQFMFSSNEWFVWTKRVDEVVFLYFQCGGLLRNIVVEVKLWFKVFGYIID